jgi:tRNA pseudouridine65 synthase
VRRHLKHLSHPIVGDVRYGKGDINRRFRSTWGLHRLALHATRLRMLHPVTNEPLDVVSPLPPELQAVLTRLELTCNEAPSQR